MRVVSLGILGALFLLVIYPVSLSAQEASEEASVCGQAVSGTVPTVEGYCDIYQRQLEYKKGAKEFRESLDARRNGYEAPRQAALETFRSNIEKLYEEESKAYQDAIAKMKESENKGQEDVDRPESLVEETPAETAEDGGNGPAEEAPAETAEDAGIKEKILPSEPDEEVVRKVVMPKDAPAFPEDAPNF